MADDARSVVTKVRTDLERVTHAAEAVSDKLMNAAATTERRMDDINAVIDVVQGELEETVMTTAAALRGVRMGGRAFAGAISSGAKRRGQQRDVVGRDYSDDGDRAPRLRDRSSHRQRDTAIDSGAAVGPVILFSRTSVGRWQTWCVILLMVALAIACNPTDLWAWTPGTHVFLGDAVLRNLTQLPGHVGELLSAFPSDFLYGSIAADTSIAKKYAAVGRHCHSWNIGLEIRDEAEAESLKAFSLGYLAHLAADVVAHNYFVPRQLAVTSSTTALGHSYWESRVDTHIGDLWPRRARELLLLDHGRSDGHLDRILSPTLFGNSTNRRIFRGMVRVTDSDSWQRIFQLVSEKQPVRICLTPTYRVT